MKEKKFLILLFVIFLIILFLSPISGDDWGNYLVGEKGIRHIIGQAIGMYFDWEGRFVSRLSINLLTYNKWLWNIVNSSLILSIIYFSVKIINPKNKKIIYLLSFLGILCMNIFTFSQTITWIAGNVTYLFPLALLIIYIYYIKYHIDNNNILILSILNLILPMFVEHMAILTVIINLFVLIYKYIKDKKIDKRFVLYLIISIISTLLMLLSPGTKLRNSIENNMFNDLSLFEKIIYNIPNFIYYTFIVNSYLLILFVICNIYLTNRQIKNKVLKYILNLYILVIPILTIVSYNLSIVKINFLNQIINPNNILIIIYWISLIIIYLYLIIKNIKEEDYKFILLITLLGLISNAVMLISPTWGYRTSLATYIFLLIGLLFIISKIKINKIIEKLLIIISIFITLIYLLIYTNLYKQNKEREKIIEEDINNNNEVIRIKKLPGYGPCNINPTNEYHLEVFKEYYNIDSEKETIMID